VKSPKRFADDRQAQLRSTIIQSSALNRNAGHTLGGLKYSANAEMLGKHRA
jgi:hypothetical protein